ncbi:MAG TPA: efflux RND transporter periplasmic adaptor subunit [Thermoanaerobaculia bacterium]|nr:efflux RND transporter periplasmic adaptor subunit [Thermoanaerobaculia bacterium]HUM30266.1 efflux RND transporter periplasmic adaptor subunit [Thermoanaerobaculia bacterium]HXK68438.1 efflux RND transporter periplasmic adaptor subunit [Thermoanaerobaculia bacterium]
MFRNPSIRTPISCLLFAGLLIFSLSSCSRARGETPDIGVPYRDTTVTRSTFRTVVTADGSVEPIDRVEIKSKASGQIITLPVEEGDSVRKGQLIARLDQKDETAAVAQASADVDIARAQLTSAQRAYERRENLLQQNLISQEEYDGQALQLAVAKGNLLRATTTLDRAQERLDEAVVQAPVSGIVLKKYVEEGQIISSGTSTVTGGTAIVDIADLRSVYIVAGINEIDIASVRVGLRVGVTTDAYPQDRNRGIVVRISPEARLDQNVTLFDVVVKVENPDLRLKPGMNAHITIPVIEKPDVLLLPVLAVQGGKNGEEEYVYVKSRAGYEPKPVKIGLRNFRDCEVLEGLEEGDVVGIPMRTQLKEENDRRENRFRSSRELGIGSRSPRS